MAVLEPPVNERLRPSAPGSRATPSASLTVFEPADVVAARVRHHVRRHRPITERLEDSARMQPEAHVDEHLADHVGGHVPERRQDDRARCRR
jgi:hypothetical protein